MTLFLARSHVVTVPGHLHQVSDVAHGPLVKKIFFSRTSRAKLINFGTNYPLVKIIQVCSNIGAGPLQKGDNHRNVRKEWGHLKILFVRTMKPEMLNFTCKHSDIKIGIVLTLHRTNASWLK